MLNAFLYTATVVFILYAVWWNNKFGWNLLIKLGFTGLAIWGALLSLVQLGFMFRR